MKYYLKAFTEMFNFKRNVSVEEFWAFFGINMLVSGVVSLICSIFHLSEWVYRIYQTITVIVMYFLGYRRLRDAGFNGWLFLIPLANLIMAIFPKKEKTITT